MWFVVCGLTGFAGGVRRLALDVDRVCGKGADDGQ